MLSFEAKPCITYKLSFFRLREAELSLTGIYNPVNPKSPTIIAAEFGSIAGVALQLLGNIYRSVNISIYMLFCFIVVVCLLF